MRRGFSLIEVIVSVALLIMVGTAMSVLNATAVKLMTANETLTTAYALNDEGLAYLSLQRHNPDVSNFDNFIYDIEGQTCGDMTTGCEVYITCPIDNVSQDCTLTGPSQKPTGVQLGRAKNVYRRSMKITKVGSDYSVEAVTSWGNATNQQVKVIKFLD